MPSGPSEELVNEARALYVPRNDTLKTRSELILTKILLMFSANGAKLFAHSLMNMSATTTSSVTGLLSVSKS